MCQPPPFPLSKDAADHNVYGPLVHQLTPLWPTLVWLFILFECLDGSLYETIQCRMVWWCPLSDTTASGSPQVAKDLVSSLMKSSTRESSTTSSGRPKSGGTSSPPVGQRNQYGLVTMASPATPKGVEVSPFGMLDSLFDFLIHTRPAFRESFHAGYGLRVPCPMLAPYHSTEPLPDTPTARTPLQHSTLTFSFCIR